MRCPDCSTKMVLGEDPDTYHCYHKDCHRWVVHPSCEVKDHKKKIDHLVDMLIKKTKPDPDK